MTAGKLLAGQVASLAAAGLGAAVVLMLRNQQEAKRRLRAIEDYTDLTRVTVRDMEKAQKVEMVAITTLLDRAREAPRRS